MSRDLASPKTHTNRWRTPALVFLLTLAALALAACGGNNGDVASGNDDGLRGTVAISGAWALYPLVVQWSEEFGKEHPDVRFDISAGGAGKGMADVLGGLVDIGMVSREVFPEEISRGAFPVGVAIDAVVPVVNASNPFREHILRRGLTREQLVGIYITGEITDWTQVFPDAQVNGDTEIKVYTRSDAAGAPETWAAYLGGKQEDLLGIAIYGDPGLAEAVRNDPLGIGYNNVGYAYNAETERPNEGLVVIPIDINGNRVIDPDEDFYEHRADLIEAIGARIYPFPPARPLYLVARDQFSGVAKAFVEWVLTDGQQFNIPTGYVPMSEADVQAALERLR